MTKSVQIVNAPWLPYFKMVLCTCLLLIATGLLTGCGNSASRDSLGSIAGIAQLSDPDPGTGNAGVLVYLAGTAHQARTDQQGRYRIDGIPAGTYDLIAEKNGYAGQIIEGLMVSAGTSGSPAPPVQPTDVLLQRQQQTHSADNASTASLGSVAGSVFLEGMPDENGGVRVELDGTAFVTVSSSDGQYRLINVEPGNYTLSFYREGFLAYQHPEPIGVTSGSITRMPDVALELKQPGDPVSAGTVAEQMAASAVAPYQPGPPPTADEVRSIVGVVEVRDTAGRLISDYSDVTLAINGTSYVAAIDEQGQFRFDNLTSGVYTVIGSIPDGPLAQVPVDLETQRSASISVKLVKGAPGNEAGGVIRGIVVLVDLDDIPFEDASGVQVAVNGTQIMATTAADGSFTLEGVTPGTHRLSATRPGFVPGEADGIEVSPAAPTEAPEIRMMIDVERPRVLSTTPANATRDVAVTEQLPIAVKFSEAMDPATLEQAVVITPNTPATISIGRATGGADDTLMIVLSNASEQSPIVFGSTYRVTIPATAANLAGVTMGEPYTFTFQTAKPGVIGTSPVNNARDIYVDQNQNPVLISFNTRLDPKSINDRTVRVRPNNGKSVSVTYTNDPDTGWTTIRVGAQWDPQTNYTVNVTRRVRAHNGQLLGNTPYTLRFRTQPMDINRVPMTTVR